MNLYKLVMGERGFVGIANRALATTITTYHWTRIRRLSSTREQPRANLMIISIVHKDSSINSFTVYIDSLKLYNTRLTNL